MQREELRASDPGDWHPGEVGRAEPTSPPMFLIPLPKEWAHKALFTLRVTNTPGDAWWSGCGRDSQKGVAPPSASAPVSPDGRGHGPV